MPRAEFEPAVAVRGLPDTVSVRNRPGTGTGMWLFDGCSSYERTARWTVIKNVCVTCQE